MAKITTAVMSPPDSESNSANLVVDIVTAVSTHAVVLIKYIHKNAWTIVFLLAGGYFCFYQFIHPLLRKYKTKKSYKEATNPDRVAVLSPDMKRIRAKQQEMMHQKAIEAELQRKKKVASERERKRVKSPEEERWENNCGGGKRLGTGGNDDHPKSH